jgi:transposase InsO family protein
VGRIDRNLVLTKEVIHEEQVKDALCEQYRQNDDFWLDGDSVLYKKGASGQLHIVIPSSLVLTVLESYHELPFTAHQGVERTVEFIRKKYWWESLVSDVKEYIRKCEACAKRKTGHKMTAPLGDRLEAREFLDIVSLDIVGPLPITEKGNRYLLTFIDHFTRFCDAIPIARQDTETIAREFVMKIITQFGVPKKLLTDRGANFTSVLIQETCKLLKIQKLQTSSYHPQANGLCERMHKLLIDMLSHFVRKDARNWDEYVPYAVMAYRAMPHCSTKYSPYYLVFGRDMRLPIEGDWRPSTNLDETDQDCYEEHVRRLALRLHEANTVAGQNSKLSYQAAKQYYDRRTKLEQFKKGDLVYLHDPIYKRGRAKKFSYQFKGPFKIESKVSPLIYRVCTGEGIFTVVHINRLKRAYGQKPDDSLLTTSSAVAKDSRMAREGGNQSRTPEDEDGTRGTNLEVRTNLQIDSSSDDSAGATDVSSQGDPEGQPESTHSQRKLRNDSSLKDITYQLRSRTIDKRDNEPLSRKPSEDTSADQPTQQLDFDDHLLSQPTHSYNLRKRV